ncbi:MAG: THUMP domain-containing protein [Candidatus Sifarchaeia archaeon]
MTKYFVYVSGEHIIAAKAEVDALARLLKDNTIVNWDGRIGLVESSTNLISLFLERAALVKEAGILLSEIDAQNDLLRSLSDDILKENIKPEETFSVRTISENKELSISERLSFEQNLGAHIKHVVGAKVDLDNPQIRILVVFTQERVRVCRSFKSIIRPLLRMREPGRKPFFHPSMMNATLARVMCNLVGIIPNEVVLDPFCGAGGILCEALSIGARTVGIDLNWQLLTGSKVNLASVGNNFSVIQGDVRDLPISSCDCIVTDPPYGRVSSTRGTQAIKLVEALFERADSILRRRDESICICGSSKMKLNDLAEDMGFVVSQIIQIRVHRGLVRELLTIGF